MSTANDRFLLIFRIIGLLYFTAIYIWIFHYSFYFTSLLRNVIYLTNIGYFFTWLYLLLTVQSKILETRLQKK